MTVLTLDLVPIVVRTGASSRVSTEEITPRFKVGDRIRARNMNPATHTRLPRYVRSRVGIVVMDHGVFTFADTMAHGSIPSPQHVYNIRFEASELWGEGASAQDCVHIDLWENYLEDV
ncbi:SH3-like domain-containing protein [Asaia sp. As-1742]|uniref:SH3-like domain-containing protein n=1 Tax=Asaia sp. As-1742 TaxID=2608325 RepID=UPI0019637EA5|nr:SH3-like domain-containing protein [Asaia sp. As-1742]